MADLTSNYSSIIVDLGSGVIKAGFSGEDGPRSVFNSLVGIPKMPGLLVGMEQKERYVGNEAISKLEIMNFSNPIVKGEIVDWDKFETLMHNIFYSELKVVPEEISVLITETPLNSKENRARLAETLFETFNVERLHIANTGMLGLYSYGKTSGLVLDSGYGVTTCVPVYEGYPLPHASIKMNYGGENLSDNLLNMIKHKINKTYKGVKGKLLAEDIKDKLGFIAINAEEEEKFFLDTDREIEYNLPDGEIVKLNTEIFRHSESLFSPISEENSGISQFILDSLAKCDNDIMGDIQENICLTGGTTLMRGFTDRLRNELMQSISHNNFNLVHSPERQFSNWIGGSIVSSLSNFSFMWVSKQDYDETGSALEAVDSKCF